MSNYKVIGGEKSNEAAFNTTNNNVKDVPPNYDTVDGGKSQNIGWSNPNCPSAPAIAPAATVPPVEIYIEDYGYGRGRGRRRWYKMQQMPPEYWKHVRIILFVFMAMFITVVCIIAVGMIRMI